MRVLKLKERAITDLELQQIAKELATEFIEVDEQINAYDYFKQLNFKVFDLLNGYRFAFCTNIVTIEKELTVINERILFTPKKLYSLPDEQGLFKLLPDEVTDFLKSL